MKINYRKLGLMMMAEAPHIEDHRTSNDFARVGDDLTSIGTPYFKIKTFKDLSSEQLTVVREAFFYFKEKGLENEIVVENK